MLPVSAPPASASASARPGVKRVAALPTSPACLPACLASPRGKHPPYLQIVRQRSRPLVHLCHGAQPAVQQRVPRPRRRRPQRSVHCGLHLLLKHSLDVLAQGAVRRGKHLQGGRGPRGARRRREARRVAGRQLRAKAAGQQLRTSAPEASACTCTTPACFNRCRSSRGVPSTCVFRAGQQPRHVPRPAVHPPAPTCSITTASSRSVPSRCLYRLASPRSAAASAAASASRASSESGVPTASAAAAAAAAAYSNERRRGCQGGRGHAARARRCCTQRSQAVGNPAQPPALPSCLRGCRGLQLFQVCEHGAGGDVALHKDGLAAAARGVRGEERWEGRCYAAGNKHSQSPH